MLFGAQERNPRVRIPLARKTLKRGREAAAAVSSHQPASAQERNPRVQIGPPAQDRNLLAQIPIAQNHWRANIPEGARYAGAGARAP
jgi:hypothetical protein